MSDPSIKNLLLRFLKIEYIKRSEVIKNSVEHIEKLQSLSIITNNDRNSYIKSLGEILNLLSKFYNNEHDMISNKKLINNNDQLSDNSDDLLGKFETLDIDETNDNNFLDSYIRILKLNPTDKVNKIITQKFDFNNIDTKLKKFGCEIGFSNLRDIFSIFVDYDYAIIFENNQELKEIFQIISDTFIPISIMGKKVKSENSITVSKLDSSLSSKTEILLENYYLVTISVNIKHFSIKLALEGFFNNDHLNIDVRTAHITSKYISEKKQMINRLVLTDKATQKKTKNERRLIFIPTQFKELYLKNMTLGDILITDKNAIINQIIEDYTLYQKYSSTSTFKVLLGDFIKVNLKTKFNMIRCLLITNNATNNAGLLFGLTNENKMGSNIIADIFYRNLNASAQLKLHKANKSIKMEIEKLNNLSVDDVDIKKQISLNKNIPPKVKKLAFEKLEEMKTGGSEYYKQLQYVKILAEYPWIGENDNDIFSNYQNDPNKWMDVMKSTYDELNKKVYGHTECKETIVELLGKWFRNPNSLGKAIGLYGPPGVGKTLIAKALGSALDLPFTQINLGGMEDGSILTGHSITYSGAVPGLIVKKMVEAGKPRCIMFFDELDKASFRHGRNEIYDILIHVTDPNSNADFNDKFFQDVRFPINKVLFVFSFNDRKKVEKILLDRMELIKVGAYTVDDKIKIAKDFLMKELILDIGLTKPKIDISNNSITRIIESYTNEAGVRDLRRCLEKIICKMNKDMIFKNEPFNKVVNKVNINDKIIDKYLQKPEIQIKKIHSNDEIGTVSGLYATELGSGGIIPILVYRRQMGLKNNFVLELTGKQGDTMKESVRFAFNIAINLVKQKYSNHFFSHYKNGLHIHTPDGSTQKDGPSAGSAFTLAFISKILNKKIKHDIALTGEIDRNGFISAIGGLEYKLTGAKRAGVKLVLVPSENKKDIDKIIATDTKLCDNNFKIFFVTHINEIVDYALIDTDKKINIYEKTFDHNKYFSDNDDYNTDNIDDNIKISVSNEDSDSNESENTSSKKESLESSEYDTEDMDYD